jgi:hypothetical protein
MSKFLLFIVLCFNLAFTSQVLSDEHEHHDLKKEKAGPHGGKVFHHENFDIEFFVTDSEHFQITFLNHKGEPIDYQAKNLSVVCGDRLSPTMMSFESKGKSMLSKKPKPKGGNIPAIITIVDRSGKTLRHRIQVNMASCESCVYKEYACICGH